MSAAGRRKSAIEAPTASELVVDGELVSRISSALQELAAKQRSTSVACFLKRCLDVGIAVILLVMLAPLLAAVALSIRLESPGPVFFTQLRRGRNFTPFRIWKFRSMAHGVPDPTARYETQSTDLRITRVGRIIRLTSIDELPQLFNILEGHMSLVGPRPLVEWESIEAAKTHGQRFLVPPGITGLSQVEVRNGGDFFTRLEKDVEYVRRHNLWLDLLILVKTPWQLVWAKRIYPGVP
jgi:putative colanic acid biosynthesis UDP-glucose lipid carrier transferase